MSFDTFYLNDPSPVSPIRPLKIGKFEFNNNLVLAPMAGVTDMGFRHLAKISGAGLTVTEMVSAKALLYKSEKTPALLSRSPLEEITAAQIFGSEAEVMAQMIAESPHLKKFEIIDINMGCPVHKICGNGEGSALMKDIKKAEGIVRTCAAAAKTNGQELTVKFRGGWEDSNIICGDFAKMCEESGAAAVIIHGRSRQQGFSGNVHPEYIKTVKESVKIPVIANGDICAYENVLKMYELTGVDGFMIGRAAMGNPQVFAELLNAQYPLSLKQTILTHIEMFLKALPPKVVVLNMRTHLMWYLKNISGGKQLRLLVNQITEIEQLKSFISENL